MHSLSEASALPIANTETAWISPKKVSVVHYAEQTPLK